jgi:hypothetical protein
MKTETDKIAKLAGKISTLKALLGIFEDGQPYFSMGYLKDVLRLRDNEIRMMKIGKIFYDE